MTHSFALSVDARLRHRSITSGCCDLVAVYSTKTRPYNTQFYGRIFFPWFQGRQPLSVEAVTKNKKLLPWCGLLSTSVGSGVLETREELMHSHDQTTEKGCE
jgi:hypothetical protein